MNILLVTDSYPPEIRSASHLMEELAEGLKDRGHNIAVATSYPKYNLADSDIDINYKEFSSENGIDVIRIKTLPHHKVNFVIRGIAQLSISNIFISKINKHIKYKPDAVIVYSPPLPLARVGIYFNKKFHSKFILNVQDIFPQNAIDLGVLKNKFLIRFFERMEKSIYNKADVIFVHSEGNLNFIKGRFPDLNNKLATLHNWIDVDEFDKVEKSGYFRKSYGLEGKFIILFAGVIGPSQGLDFVVNIAERVRDLSAITFLLVGDGMEKERLRQMVIEKGLDNVIFKPFLSKSEYPKLVKDADIGLVSLTSMNKTPVVPGKILGYMAAGLPIAAFLNKESDGNNIIKDSVSGYSCAHGNTEEAVEIIKNIYYKKAKIKEMGLNGYEYVKANFKQDIILDKLEKFLKN